MIIISASGRLAGVRVMHHVASFGPDPRNAIVLSGFQAGGTRGAVLARGERHLRLFGRDVEIKAEVVQLEGMSGHADANELIAWMGDRKSVGEGKSVSVRVDLGGRRIIKTKKTQKQKKH